MKILYISNPNSTHTRRWIRWFANRGHQTALIADTRLSGLWNDGIFYDYAKLFNVGILRYFIWGFWVKKFVRNWKPQILHAHRVSSAGWTGLIAGFHPFVVTPWGSDLYRQPYQKNRLASWMIKHAARATLRNADLVTADSRDLCQKAIDFDADPTRTHLVGWGVDLQVFNPPSLDNTNGIDAPDSFRLTQPVILSPRGINPVYNIDTIVRSIPRVKEKFPDVKFILRNYNCEAGYYRHILGLIDQMELHSSIEWIEKLEPYELVADLYRKANIAVSVSESDGTPVSILEALACGIPVIGGDLPSLREWITDGENGYLINPHDPALLADKIISLLNDPGARRRFREYNWPMIKERADHEQEMKKMEVLYRELI